MGTEATGILLNCTKYIDHVIDFLFYYLFNSNATVGR